MGLGEHQSSLLCPGCGTGYYHAGNLEVPEPHQAFRRSQTSRTMPVPVVSITA